jgi:hypothetical protein
MFLYCLTQHTECVTFKFIYLFIYYHYMFPQFIGHHQVNNIIYQMFFWVANQFTYMGPYLQSKYIYTISILYVELLNCNILKLIKILNY